MQSYGKKNIVVVFLYSIVIVLLAQNLVNRNNIVSNTLCKSITNQVIYYFSFFQQAKNRLKSAARYTQGNHTLPYNPVTYSEVRPLPPCICSWLYGPRSSTLCLAYQTVLYIFRQYRIFSVYPDHNKDIKHTKKITFKREIKFVFYYGCRYYQYLNAKSLFMRSIRITRVTCSQSTISMILCKCSFIIYDTNMRSSNV